MASGVRVTTAAPASSRRSRSGHRTWEQPEQA